MLELRPYQSNSITLARESFAKGNKDICLCLATGSGKSIIARKIVEAFREKSPNGKIAYLTFRNVLINQMKDTLKGLNVEIDTLQAKGKNLTDLYDLVLIDEVHFAKNSKLQNNINSKFKLGLTATPITSDGYALEFDEIIDVVQLADLIKMGYAAPVKVISNSNVDTSTLKKSNGDYNIKDSFNLMSKSQVKKDIVDTYKKYAQGLKTIVYCVNVQHAEELKKEFLESGIICDSVHSKKKDTVKAIQDFRDNKINLLLNVDILVTGVDMPDIYCLILAAPTKSLIKSTQIYGRATRLNPDDPNKTALIIDCAKVIQDTQHPLQRFDFTRKKQDKHTKCPSCKNKMKLINRFTETIDQYEYKVISDYKCDCGETLQQENYKIINRELCEDGTHFFEPVNGLQMKSNDKSLNFNLVCKCGFEKKFRQVLYTDEELKEVKLEQALESGATWEDVATILKAECKKHNYKWQYSIRLVDSLKAKKYTPKNAIEAIKTILKRGDKISKLMYI